MLFYLPIALTALATTLYHIAQNSIVPGVHPMVSLVITYATSLVACLVVVPFAPGGQHARALAEGPELGDLRGRPVDRGGGAGYPTRLPRRVAHQPRLGGRERDDRPAAGGHRSRRLPGAPRRAPRGGPAHVPRRPGPDSPAVASARASATARSTASSSSWPGLPSVNCWLVAYTPLAITVAPRLANSGRSPWSTESAWAAPWPVTSGTPIFPIKPSCGSRSKNTFSNPL